MPRRQAYGKRQLRGDLRAARVLDMWANKRLTYREIAKVEGIHLTRVQQLVHGALNRQQRERDQLGEQIRDMELERLDHVLRASYEIAMRECPHCRGFGTRNDKVCTRCGGEGFMYPPERRDKALDRIAKVTEQRVRILGIQPPEVVDMRHHLVRDFRDVLQGKTDEELRDEYANYIEGTATEITALPELEPPPDEPPTPGPDAPPGEAEVRSSAA